MSFRFPFYPLLLASYFPIFLYSQNISRYSPLVALYPVLWALLAASLFLGISWSLFKDVHKAAFWLSTNFGIFFLYGSLYTQFKEIISGTNFIILSIFISMNMGVFFLFWKKKHR